MVQSQAKVNTLHCSPFHSDQFKYQLHINWNSLAEIWHSQATADSINGNIGLCMIFSDHFIMTIAGEHMNVIMEQQLGRH